MTTDTKKLSQKDYLKKYLSGPSDDKKKKKKKKPKGPEAVVRAKVKVIDDDVDLSKLQSIDESALDLYELNEDAPQIVGVVDERPAELQALDQYKQSQRWKVLGDSDGDGLKVSELGGSNHQERRHTPTSDLEEDFNIRPVSKFASTGKSKRKDLDASPPRRRRGNDSDESPPRKKKQHDSDESPQRKKKQYDSDESPPRKSRQNDSDESPPRKGKPKDSYRSPLKKRRQNDSDESPPRKKRQDNADVSPPRRKKAYDSDASPPRRGHHNESPPIKKNTTESSKFRQSEKSHYSRKHGYDSDASPPRKKGQNHPNNSPPRRRKNSDSDTSPPRKRLSRRDSEEHDMLKVKIKIEKDDEKEKKEKMKKTLDGKVAGLQDAKKLKQELLDFKQREEEAFSKMDHSLSGRGAVAVQRDRKTGLKRDLDREAAEQRAKDEKEQKRKEKYTRWGKGLKQTEDQQERFERDTYEMSKPLARYADDKDLDSYLKEQDREGDPMLEYLRNKKKEETKSKVPLYQGSFPPNRYGIRPGYRWDGVDRSNGYEKKRFEAMNSQKAGEEEAYKWSTSDM